LLWPLACAASAQDLPGLGTHASRLEIDVDQPPWRIIGRVQTGLGERCTGFAVAPNVIETAGHCLWIARTGHFVPAWDVHALFGYRMGAFRIHARATQIVVASGYDPHREATTAWTDRALIVLDQPVVKAADLLPMVPTRGGMAAMLGGYQQDRSEIAIGDTRCRIVAIDRIGTHTMLRHDCAGTHGVSGAPLLVRDDGGHWGIAGVAVLAFAGAGGLAASLPH